MKLGTCDHLGEVLEVVGLKVHDVESLVRVLKVSEVDPEVIGGDEGLAV